MHTGAIKKGQRVLLIDDLIATGGTLAAGVKLIEQVIISILKTVPFYSHTDQAISHSSTQSMLPVCDLSFLATPRPEWIVINTVQASLGSFCTCQSS